MKKYCTLKLTETLGLKCPELFQFLVVRSSQNLLVIQVLCFNPPMYAAVGDNQLKQFAVLLPEALLLQSASAWGQCSQHGALSVVRVPSQ